jgi:broad specificity phosphatase PhoE
VLRTKRLIFLRHGESQWNEVFNKGFGPSFFLRLAKAFVREIRLLSTRDSVFFDSPINHEGAEQALKVREFLAHRTETPQPEVSVLRGEVGRTMIVASNLRRCIETTTIAFWDRLERTGESVSILSSLQEISSNVDTIALAGRREIPEVPMIEKTMGRKFLTFDTRYNYGNKPIFGSGVDRLKAFAEWAFTQDVDVIIVGGHSLWCRDFFRTFLPYNRDHISKNAKIKNCGLVALTLQHGRTSSGNDQYRIDPDSILNVFGGFEKPSKKPWSPPKPKTL